MSKIEIAVNGNIYGGWLSASVTADINSISRAFALEVTTKLPNTDMPPIKPSDTCEVLINGELVLSGYVDATPISYNATSITRQIQGRSKTCDLVDCQTPPKDTKLFLPKAQWLYLHKITNPKVITTWNNTETGTIIKELCAPYQISTNIEAELSKKNANFTIVPTDTVLSSITKLITLDNLLVFDDEKGQLVIAKVGSNGNANDNLVTGENILNCSYNYSYANVFSDYIVSGQCQNDGSKAPIDCTLKDSSKNSIMPRPRFKYVQRNGNVSADDVKNGADFEANFDNANALQITYRVQGWVQSNGSLWQLNTLVHVIDKVLKIDKTLLISKLNFTVNNNGSVTDITLIDPSAYRSKGVQATSSDKAPKKDKEQSESKSPWANVKPWN